MLLPTHLLCILTRREYDQNPSQISLERTNKKTMLRGHSGVSNDLTGFFRTCWRFFSVALRQLPQVADNTDIAPLCWLRRTFPCLRLSCINKCKPRFSTAWQSNWCRMLDNMTGCHIAITIRANYKGQGEMIFRRCFYSIVAAQFIIFHVRAIDVRRREEF